MSNSLYRRGWKTNSWILLYDDSSPFHRSIPSFLTHPLRVHTCVYFVYCCSFQYQHAAHAEELMPAAKRILPPALKLDYALLVARLTRLISRERRIAANIQKRQKRFPGNHCESFSHRCPYPCQTFPLLLRIHRCVS